MVAYYRVVNGLSKRTNLGKFELSLGISALKKASRNLGVARTRTVSESQILNLANAASFILYFLRVLDHCVSGSDFWSAKSRAWIFKPGSRRLGSLGFYHSPPLYYTVVNIITLLDISSNRDIYFNRFTRSCPRVFFRERWLSS